MGLRHCLGSQGNIRVSQENYLPLVCTPASISERGERPVSHRPLSLLTRRSLCFSTSNLDIIQDLFDWSLSSKLLAHEVGHTLGAARHDDDLGYGEEDAASFLMWSAVKIVAETRKLLNPFLRLTAQPPSGHQSPEKLSWSMTTLASRESPMASYRVIKLNSGNKIQKKSYNVSSGNIRQNRIHTFTAKL